jgi:hypothetical protein
MHERPLPIAAAAVVIVALALLAAFAAVGFAQDRGPAASAQYEKKVTICHHAQGKNGTKHVTIRVSRNALPAHLRHGDTVGACSTSSARVKHNAKAHVTKFHKQAKAKKSKRRGKK